MTVSISARESDDAERRLCACRRWSTFRVVFGKGNDDTESRGGTRRYANDRSRRESTRVHEIATRRLVVHTEPFERLRGRGFLPQERPVGVVE